MTSPLLEIASARASRSRCPLYRKRESQHHVSGCKTSRIRLRHKLFSACAPPNRSEPTTAAPPCHPQPIKRRNSGVLARETASPVKPFVRPLSLSYDTAPAFLRKREITDSNEKTRAQNQTFSIASTRIAQNHRHAVHNPKRPRIDRTFHFGVSRMDSAR